MKIHWKSLIVCLLIPLTMGGLSGFLARDGMKAFSDLQQPPLSPPGWLFPVVWTILYILMGIASYLALKGSPGSAHTYRAGGSGSEASVHPGISGSSLTTSDPAGLFYALQLFFNFGWSLIFFNLEAYLLAFFWLVILWTLIAITTILFAQKSRTAGLLMLPYLSWVTFAGYLNLGIWWLHG